MRDRIAEALRAANLLGETATFEYDELPTLAHSLVARVRVESPGSPVRRLVFKASSTATDSSIIRETRFYRSIGRALPAGTTPGCLAANSGDGTAALLLEDMSQTHRPATDGGPTFREAVAFIETLAQVHATGLVRPGLEAEWAREFGDLPGHNIEDRLRWLLGACDEFLASAEGVNEHARQLIVRIVGAGPNVLGDSDPRTILHGDAHYWNGLYSPQGAALLDWGNACIGPPGVDLAHAIALNLPPDVRMGWEDHLMGAYASRMGSRGVAATADKARTWYRRGVLYAMVVPVAHRAMGIPWRRLLENVTAAAEDLDVEALL